MNVLELLMASGVRNYRAGDVIPPELKAGFELIGKLDADWVWVVEEEGQFSGVLIAAPCHGTAVVYRLAVLPGTRVGLLFKLLRAFLADTRERGCVGYITFVDPNIPAQAKLKRIIERTGGLAGAANLVMMGSPMPKGFV